MSNRFKLRRYGARAWLLFEVTTGIDVGGITYEHSGNGNHYRPWLLVAGARHNLGEPVPQLAMAARIVEAGSKQPRLP